MTASLSAALLWLLLAGAGVTALFASASARLNEAFGTDARILHRVLSQQEFPRLLESCATRRHDGTGKGKRRSARHFTRCVLEGIFGRDRLSSA
ncbi:hypothetical protein IHN32_12500 [Deinococcus sp. 14RED07]|uniref:hypothetical protein n=1 Tax=Deinococcus sp. 14RED07 TaxID=2745874 RepID=UPI001E5189B0|nr:hypothetical protein [Deinococcus sp. 14RED07]MCD0176763.1 hypothetical protein [Deinococcus sp. 14RED07]